MAARRCKSGPPRGVKSRRLRCQFQAAVFSERRSLASVLIFELLIALKYHASIFSRGMPDLSAVETATVSADDFTVKSLVAVSSAQFLAPCHFFLHRFKFLRSNNGFMRTFYIILRHLAVIYPQFFR